MIFKKKNIITLKTRADFIAHLRAEEKAEATIEKYARDVRAFSLWIGGAKITKKETVRYKQYLTDEQKRKAAGVNATIAALNAFFDFMQWDVKLKPLKIQRQTFKAAEKELTKPEYEKLLISARERGNERLNLVLQTICSTGIRVSELRFITVEAMRSGNVEITNKGKRRIVFIPERLTPILLDYAEKRSITSGCIFVTKTGKPLNRSNVWTDMKKLCASAGVEPSKVFPHNLRALFARLFYGAEKDIVRLADVLGHSNVNTTRIYLMESGDIHRKRVDALGLIITEC